MANTHRAQGQHDLAAAASECANAAHAVFQNIGYVVNLALDSITNEHLSLKVAAGGTVVTIPHQHARNPDTPLHAIRNQSHQAIYVMGADWHGKLSPHSPTQLYPSRPRRARS